jgi:hypothetical protein
MAHTKATLQTSWKGTGTIRDPYRPAIMDDHPALSWTDVTGAPGGHGATFQIHAVLTPTQLTAIQADPKYSGAVLATAPAV